MARAKNANCEARETARQAGDLKKALCFWFFLLLHAAQALLPHSARSKTATEDICDSKDAWT
jgi:hypothetical protein